MRLKKIDKILLIFLLFILLTLARNVYADLTGTEGLAIDLSSAGAGTDFTIAFDPTELLGNRTWGDASTDTIVWTWNRSTGTDPTITFNSGSIALPALTLTADLAVAEGGTGQSNLTNLITLTTHTTGNYSTGNAEAGDALVAITVEITDNESTAENNPLVFVAGADPDGGDLPLETDGDAHYNPSTGTVTATEFAGGGASLTAVDAATGDSATDFFDAGSIIDARIDNNITIDLATLATTVTMADDDATDDNHDILFTTDAAGAANVEADIGDFQYNPSSGTMTATMVAANLTTTINIVSEPKHMVFNIINPLATQTEDNEICLWPAVPAALTITKLEVTLNSAANEVAGDLKWADAFIGLAGATVIETFDTTAGVRVDAAIATPTVASGKCIYIAFDSAPNTAITQMCVDITFDYDVVP